MNISSVINVTFNDHTAQYSASHAHQCSHSQKSVQTISATAISIWMQAPLYKRITLSDLDKIAPCFAIRADQVQILKEPREFYEVLKSKILGAKKRVFISTLYVGKTEQELLAAEFGDRVEIRMFHTPNLAGFRKAVLPKRINEGWGLQHMKLNGFDDEVMLSGANLSNDYFTNRQDRYHLFSSSDVTRFYERIHDTVCNISFKLLPSPSKPTDFSLEYPSSNTGPSPLEEPKTYIETATRLLAPLIRPSSGRTSAQLSSVPHDKSPQSNTLIYPILQFTPLFSYTHTSDTDSTELPALTLLLKSLTFPPFKPAQWTFTAGYFNMTPTTRDLLLSSLTQPSSPSAQSTDSTPQPRGTIITAHPHANGFFGSKGVSGMLPPAYTLMSKRFLDVVFKTGLQDRLGLYEWKRGSFGEQDRWTYHAKGLWITLPASNQPTAAGQAPSAGPSQQSGSKTQTSKGEAAGPCVTIVGSSNYTKRSHTLDLEANALILTTDLDLQRRLKEEEQYLMQHAGRPIGMQEFEKEERKVGWGVRVALWITNLIGGAL
ncbi:MAG: hypothetical protein Q9159_001953 [Coniocarpon cinnabarinum]